MPIVPIQHIPPRARVLRLIASSGLSAATAATVRVMGLPARSHYQAIPLIFVLPLILLYLLLSQRRVPARKAMGWFILESAAVNMAFFVACVPVSGSLDPLLDLAFTLAGLWVYAIAAAVVVLTFYQHYYRLENGPYCPRCGYCLIGAPADICPECGRTFTVAELGISREALQAPPLSETKESSTMVRIRNHETQFSRRRWS